MTPARDCRECGERVVLQPTGWTHSYPWLNRDHPAMAAETRSERLTRERGERLAIYRKDTA